MVFVRAVAVAMLAAVLVSGCSSGNKLNASKAFCLAVDRYNTEINREIRRGTASGPRQLPLVAAIARTAPKKIARDAQAFRDAMRRVVNNPSATKDRPKDKVAADNVLRFANEACSVYSREGGI